MQTHHRSSAPTHTLMHLYLHEFCVYACKCVYVLPGRCVVECQEAALGIFAYKEEQVWFIQLTYLLRCFSLSLSLSLLSLSLFLSLSLLSLSLSFSLSLSLCPLSPSPLSPPLSVSVLVGYDVSISYLHSKHSLFTKLSFLWHTGWNKQDETNTSLLCPERIITPTAFRHFHTATLQFKFEFILNVSKCA